MRENYLALSPEFEADCQIYDVMGLTVVRRSRPPAATNLLAIQGFSGQSHL